MRFIQTIIIVALIVAFSSCRKDFTTIESFGKLEFSKDTVFLDTIFSNIGSATYNLKVYNRSNKAISIPQIQLKNGVTSNYRLNVDGIAGQNFEDIEILANDSIYVFVETTIDFNAVTDPLYTDQILFDNGSKQQDVDLVTLVKDATFIFPERDPMTMEIDQLTLDGTPTAIQGRFLEDSELTFTNEKPYVIYGYAAVPAGKTLTIEAGAQIHFHDNSGLIIDNGATLKVDGTLDEKVIFEGDRLEDSFSNVSGQWGTIWIREGSVDNEVNFAEIKNAIIGMLVDGLSPTSPTLTLNNVEIYNNVNFGILGRTTSINGNNVVIGSAGQTSLAATGGGRYNFNHATFANYWNNSLRTLPSVLVNNFILTENDKGEDVAEVYNLEVANFTNCIMHGNNNVELVMDKLDAGGTFNYNISNSLIKFNDINDRFAENTELDFSNTTHYNNITLNGNPDFRDPFKEDFIIGVQSDAINKALPTAITTDILGVARTNPDIGAYQHITFD
ncbi:hypothetical protein [Tenacibaculum sp. M341]|uniref:hypothetical protein n=1 Tax=Tenacibaculum sp. M341 TaxID=2530339 RepID=UPI00104F7F19|nr:hypothetical protein [Tenacibaculum sp. M341]TCI84684.1 hypothetical protein EYW44_20180 [Tenacibaculum sp. M341]